MIHSQKIDSKQNDDKSLDTAVKKLIGEGRIISLQYLRDWSFRDKLKGYSEWMLVWED